MKTELISTWFILSCILCISSSENAIRSRGSKGVSIPSDSTVHVIAPSGKSSASDLPTIRTYLTTNNLVPDLRPDIYSTDEPIYANTDEFRAMDLINALTDNSSLVWCIRGGAGAIRLIPYLEASLPAQLPPKLFIGYSDITVLHTYLIKRYDWSTVHGGMLLQIVNNGLDSESVSLLWDIINERRATLDFSITCMNSACRNNTGSIASKIVGGNLVLVQASVGTVWEIETANKLLFLEDTGEAPFRTERTLDHIKQAGIINGAAGVLLGDFIGSGDENLNTFVLQRFADSLDTVPVFRLLGIGHGRRNLPLPLNSNAEISFITDVSRLLTVETPAYSPASNYYIH